VANSGREVLSGSVGGFAIGSPFSLTQGAGAFILQPHQSLMVTVKVLIRVVFFATVPKPSFGIVAGGIGAGRLTIKCPPTPRPMSATSKVG
jgi:hypothetical protein